MGNSSSQIFSSNFQSHQFSEEPSEMVKCPTQDLRPMLTSVLSSKKKIQFHYIQPLKVANDSIGLKKSFQYERQTLKEVLNQPVAVSSVQSFCGDSNSPKISVFWNSFIKIKNKNYLDDYEVIKQLGRGAFGKVYRTKMKFDGKLERAVKTVLTTMVKSEKNQKKLLTQISIPRGLDHPNIVKLYEVFQWERQFALVMQLCDGGDLFDVVRKWKTCSERKVAQIISQILRAVVYLHKMKIVHRDLKPQNILYSESSGLFKIADFGLSAKLEQGQKLDLLTGTPYYIAPEVIEGQYDEKCDVWSVGIMIYVLLSGIPPFYGSSHRQIFWKVKNHEVDMKAPVWEKRSKQVKKLLSQMLQKNPVQRITASDALNSEWIQKTRIDHSSKYDGLTQETGQDILRNIKNFRFKNRLQAVVYTYIASQLYEDQDKASLLRTFHQIDKDKDGMIGRQELMEVFNKSSFKNTVTQEELQNILNMIDFNSSGLIDFTQFLVAASREESLLNLSRLENAFGYLDSDHSGYISAQQIKMFLDRTKQSEQEITKIFQQADQNGDGQISKQEFLDLVLRNKRK